MHAWVAFCYEINQFASSNTCMFPNFRMQSVNWKKWTEKCKEWNHNIHLKSNKSKPVITVRSNIHKLQILGKESGNRIGGPDESPWKVGGRYLVKPKVEKSKVSKYNNVYAPCQYSVLSGTVRHSEPFLEGRFVIPLCC